MDSHEKKNGNCCYPQELTKIENQITAFRLIFAQERLVFFLVLDAFQICFPSIQIKVNQFDEIFEVLLSQFIFGRCTNTLLQNRVDEMHYTVTNTTWRSGCGPWQILKFIYLFSGQFEIGCFCFTKFQNFVQNRLKAKRKYFSLKLNSIYQLDNAVEKRTKTI